MRARTVAEKATWKAAWIAFCAAGLVAGPLFADNAELGRKHASKAGQLAAKNKCKAAVSEFTKAYKLFKDPALLFNRAECYRRIGKDAEALKDYQQFLADMPTAPNRQNVEERIASLKLSVASVAPDSAATRAAPDPAGPSAAQLSAPGAPVPSAASAPAAAKSGPPASATATKPESDEPPEEKVPVRHAEKWTD